MGAFFGWPVWSLVILYHLHVEMAVWAGAGGRVRTYIEGQHRKPVRGKESREEASCKLFLVLLAFVYCSGALQKL